MYEERQSGTITSTRLHDVNMQWRYLFINFQQWSENIWRWTNTNTHNGIRIVIKSTHKKKIERRKINKTYPNLVDFIIFFGLASFAVIQNDEELQSFWTVSDMILVPDDNCEYHKTNLMGCFMFLTVCVSFSPCSKIEETWRKKNAHSELVLWLQPMKIIYSR